MVPGSAFNDGYPGVVFFTLCPRDCRRTLARHRARQSVWPPNREPGRTHDDSPCRLLQNKKLPLQLGAFTLKFTHLLPYRICLLRGPRKLLNKSFRHACQLLGVVKALAWATTGFQWRSSPPFPPPCCEAAPARLRSSISFHPRHQLRNGLGCPTLKGAVDLRTTRHRRMSERQACCSGLGGAPARTGESSVQTGGSQASGLRY